MTVETEGGNQDKTAPYVPVAPEHGSGWPHLVFLVVLGAAGWALLLAASHLHGFGPPARPIAGAVPFALFFLVILGARSLAFRVLPDTVVSLDAGFYIAAAFCLGSLAAGRLVALALTLDALLRLLGRGGRGGRTGMWTGAPRREGLPYVLYFGGMSGGLLTAIGWLWGLDGLPGGGVGVEAAVLGLVVGVGLCFLVAHYALQGVRLYLGGQPPRAFLRRMALPGIAAEASVLPLAALVVYLYRPEQPLGFMLLGATYLLINFVFGRLTRASRELRRRVAELETLNATARGLAASLEIHELVAAVARETLGAIPQAETLTLTHRLLASDGKKSELVVDSFERRRARFARFHVGDGDGEGVTGWVMKHGTPLTVPDLAASELGARTYADSGVRSWMGVPIAIHGALEGVLAVQSHDVGAFGPEEQRLLEAIGAQTAVALQNARLYEMAMVDGLTGLFVRRYLDARLEEEVQRARRFGAEFSLIMMDIDDFKQLNDREGHPVGDETLRQIAAQVKRGMRGVDTAARYGGEEFAIILPGTGMVDAYSVAERLRAEIADLRIHAAGKRLTVTASMGIAGYPESGEGTADDVVRRADTALYRAKRTGKNRVELFWGGTGEGRAVVRST